MPNSYKTGTVAATNGSPTVTGAGTAFLINAVVGGRFVLGSFEAEVLSVDSNTSLTLDANYTGANASGQTYRIWLTDAKQATNIQVNQNLSTIIAQLTNRATEVQSFLDAENVTAARNAIGVPSVADNQNASLLTTGTIADARLAARIQPSGASLTDWNSIAGTGFYYSARQIDGVANTPEGATSPFSNRYWTGFAVRFNTSTIYVEVSNNLNSNTPSPANEERFGRWRTATGWQAWFRIRQSEAELDARFPYKPKTGAGIGQFTAITTASGASFTLPAGGTWAYSFNYINSSSFYVSTAPGTGIAAGGAVLAGVAGFTLNGWAWRIS